MAEIALVPIGQVHNAVTEPRRGGWEDIPSELVLDEGFTDFLDGVEGFSHLIVVYWMHRLPAMEHPPARVHPMGRAELPLVGLFATRAPYRPNPLGVTVVRLVERQGPVLKVVGLDALDGSPLIDIKPFIPPADSPPDVSVPEWAERP
ncbi:MAG: tRNA (N6-threonylcarbamoyladenosine(37)-N6)-methyltransferase TrmO [Chloroflexota bacterium]|nr:tRNA (N6-threonylcarbamoyladenosine(37)-N6)-methyltransferase TrmO [Chloroflexota bacterium]